MLTKFLNAMVVAAVSHGRSGHLLNGPYGPGQFTPPVAFVPNWHPDRRMLPPLTDPERAAFHRLTGCR
ncbi:hypothetical protein [Amycolatopsis sp. NPDC051371]|uniref:hypothetical protein n=1 Tax=Amycolatopsis sp. NPDC051371 TaxID=3155800 RepID=UPI00343C64DB